MRFKCQYCQFINHAPDNLAGRMTLCKSCGKSIRVPNGLEEHTIIGDFELGEKIGSGSMGTVYKATELSLGRQVALKILFPQYANMKGLQEFLKEARAAAMLNHPNIVQAYAIGEVDSYTYLAMPLISGITLKQRIKRDHSLPVDEALHIIQQIAEALHYAWTESKIIHRDVKPENIMVTDNGVAKLTDMGLAIKQKDIKEGMEISGSPSYMSPEQFLGQDIDSRTDIYSLGVTLYEILCGQLPFKGQTIEEVSNQHINEDAIPLSKMGRNIPATVSALVRKMMAKHPNERFQSMDELLQQIWKTRQKTAPDRELIPSVHTISINRLDYDRYMLKSDSNKEHAFQQYDGFNFPFATEQSIFKQFKNTLSIILLGIIICMTLIISILLINRSSINHTELQMISMRNRIELYREMSTRIDATESYIKQQGDALLNELKLIGNLPAYNAWTSLITDFALLKREAYKAQAFESNYYAIRENLNEKIKLEKELTQKNLLLEKKIASIEPKDEKAMSELYERTQGLETQLMQLNESYRNELQKKDDKNSALIKKWFDTFTFQTYFMIRVGSTSPITDLCRDENLPDTRFIPMSNFIKQMSRISDKIDHISNTGAPSLRGTLTNFNNAQLSLFKISKDEISFTNPINEIVYYDFKTFPTEELGGLIKPIFLAENRPYVTYTLAIKRGDIGVALQNAPDTSLAFTYASNIAKLFYDNALLAAQTDSARLLEYEKDTPRVFGHQRTFRSERRHLEKLFREAKAKIFTDNEQIQKTSKTPIKE